MSTRIALFAAGPVGLKVAECFRGNPDAPACLVTDDADHDALVDRIVAACGVPSDRVLANGCVATPRGRDALRSAAFDLGILAWWPHILEPDVLGLARRGFLNLHPSLLPHGRGKDPNFWSIVEQAPFGVTIHWVDSTVDGGDIAFQAEIPVAWTDTGASLYEKAQRRIVELFETSLPRILAGDIPRRPQPPGGQGAHRRCQLDAACEIILDQRYTARDLLNLIRARSFRPHPGAWFTAGGRTYEVRIEITEAAGE